MYDDFSKLLESKRKLIQEQNKVSAYICIYSHVTSDVCHPHGVVCAEWPAGVSVTPAEEILVSCVDKAVIVSLCPLTVCIARV